MAQQELPKKAWYKSKIVLFSGTAILIFGGQLILGSLFRSGVTPEQVAAMQQAYPQAEEIFNRIQAGENATNLIGLIINVVILISRGWFTSVPILGK